MIWQIVLHNTKKGIDDLGRQSLLGGGRWLLGDGVGQIAVYLFGDHGAAMDGGNFAVGVDEDGGRQGTDEAVVLGGEFAFVEDGGEGEAKFVVEEGGDIFGGFVLIQGQDDKTVILILFKGGLQVGHFDAAGTAPGSPEVDDDGLAAELAENDVVAV